MALETLLCGIAAAVAVLAILLCGIVVEVVVLVTQLVAGSGTATVQEVQEKALEHMTHVWMAVLERWSESMETATALCHRPGIVVAEVPVRLLEAGTAVVVELVRRPWEALGRLLWAVAGTNVYASSVSMAAVRATLLSRHVSGMLAQADASLCGHASRAC